MKGRTVLEVEMKFPVQNHQALETLLAKLGARGGHVLDETDHYFNAPDRDFGKTDEALRLRRNGTDNFVTYKGPKRDTRTKTRTELEVPLASGNKAAEQFEQLLIHLGYQSVAVVHKARRIYRLTRGPYTLEICLDDVEHLGTFVEIEVQAPESELDPARKAVEQLATELGLGASERRSYLELLLEKWRNQIA